MRLLAGIALLLAPGCLYAWDAYKTDVTQQAAAENSDGLDHLEPVDRKITESPGLIEYSHTAAKTGPDVHVVVYQDDKSGKFFVRTWNEAKGESQGAAAKVELPVDMASCVYAMWVNALLEVRYDRLASPGGDGATDLFSAYLKGRGWLHGAATNPTKDLPPKWMEDSAKVLIQFTKDQDEKACRANLIGLRDKLFAYLETNGKG